MGVSALFDNAHFEKFFKNYKAIKVSIFNTVANLLYSQRTQRGLGLSKGTRETFKGHLSTPRALQRHFKGTLTTLGHSSYVLSQLVINFARCNKKHDAFCDKVLSRFVVNSHSESKMKL